MAGGVAAIVAASLLAYSLVQGNQGTSILFAGVFGACLGFLWHNWEPARIFLGDSGSLTLGFLFGAMTAHSSIKAPAAVAILVPILALGLPVIDTLLVMALRFVEGRGRPLAGRVARVVHAPQSHPPPPARRAASQPPRGRITPWSACSAAAPWPGRGGGLTLASRALVRSRSCRHAPPRFVAGARELARLSARLSPADAWWASPTSTGALETEIVRPELLQTVRPRGHSPARARGAAVGPGGSARGCAAPDPPRRARRRRARRTIGATTRASRPRPGAHERRGGLGGLRSSARRAPAPCHSSGSAHASGGARRSRRRPRRGARRRREPLPSVAWSGTKRARLPRRARPEAGLRRENVRAPTPRSERLGARPAIARGGRRPRRRRGVELARPPGARERARRRRRRSGQSRAGEWTPFPATSRPRPALGGRSGGQLESARSTERRSIVGPSLDDDGGELAGRSRVAVRRGR